MIHSFLDLYLISFKYLPNNYDVIIMCKSIFMFTTIKKSSFHSIYFICVISASPPPTPCPLITPLPSPPIGYDCETYEGVYDDACSLVGGSVAATQCLIDDTTVDKVTYDDDDTYIDRYTHFNKPNPFHCIVI